MSSLLEHPQAQNLLDEASIAPSQVSALARRIHRFLEPYLPLFPRSEHRDHALMLLEGKLSALQRKTAEPIAHQAGVHRKPVQHFLGAGAWDEQPLLARLREEVARVWRDPQGVITVDGSGFPKKGEASVGVARQWCGRLGKIDNCQVGIFVGYACKHGHTLLDCRLFLPEDWDTDKQRREKAHIPEEVHHQEDWRIALDLLARCRDVPHAWVTGDDEFGRVQEFRAELRERGERYLVDVPANTLIRDLDELPPVQTRRSGSPPKAPFETVAAWTARQPAERWREVEVRPGEKGVVRVQTLMGRVQTTWHNSHLGPEERLLVQRHVGTNKISYHPGNAGPKVGLEELVKAKGKHQEVEQCFQESKGDVGLGHYEVRSWLGWHHHMALSLLALWFLAWERFCLGKAERG